MTAPSGPKSTVVRAKAIAVRTGFRTTELLAPALGARFATRRWFTVPPPPRVRPLPAGGQPFTVIAQHAAVRGFSFGAGPVIYLMHGWGGLGAQLGAFVEPLRANGFQVVVFDAPAHGGSDPGPFGPGRTHALEFGHALEAVAARFGPAQAVIAHSMGAVPTLLAQVHGSLTSRQLIFLAPMRDLATHFDRFAAQLGVGPRVRNAMTVETERRVDYPVAGIDVRVLARLAEPVPLLVVHDRGDRETSHQDSVELVETWRGPATLTSTDGLGHRRLLIDTTVIGETIRFLHTGLEAKDSAQAPLSDVPSDQEGPISASR
jgi:pimeloyl-ACP methyl ester carboxylesterase